MHTYSPGVMITRTTDRVTGRIADSGIPVLQIADENGGDTMSVSLHTDMLTPAQQAEWLHGLAAAADSLAEQITARAEWDKATA